MALLEIRLAPDPVLRRKARTVKTIDAALRKLARDMIETMQDAKGVGLAANQVGVLKRLIVLQMPEEDPFALVNPEITKREGEREIEEGCLSIPGYVGLIKRSVRVRARALTEMGDKWRVTAEELLAQALEHEIDHLNGILYTDHLEAHQQLRKVDAPPAEEAHLHDVEYEVHADHSDGDAPSAADQDERGPSLESDAGAARGQVELLHAHAKLSQVRSESSLSELAYDLTTRPDGDGNATDGRRTRIHSTDPALDGGVLLEPPH